MNSEDETPYNRPESICAYCGGEPSTDDHVPARVFLDERHEKAAHVVGACLMCNSGASSHEEFVACLLESVVCGSNEGASLGREKIRRTLAHSPRLGRRIARWRSPTLFGDLDWAIPPEQFARVERIVVKLARGLVAHEHASAQLDEPEDVSIASMLTLTSAEREAFEKPPGRALWPEVGSRALVQMCEGRESWPWVVVQPERFRYRVDGTEVRMALREYLACVVRWA